MLHKKEEVRKGIDTASLYCYNVLINAGMYVYMLLVKFNAQITKTEKTSVEHWDFVDVLMKKRDTHAKEHSCVY